MTLFQGRIEIRSDVLTSVLAQKSTIWDGIGLEDVDHTRARFSMTVNINLGTFSLDRRSRGIHA